MARHICHIATTYNLRSGFARRTTAILRSCVAEGYRVTLITGRDHDVRPDDLPGVEIHVVPELVKYLSPLSDMVVPWKLWALLRHLRPDLVHTHLAKAGIAGRLAGRLAGIPQVLHTVHGPTFPAYFSFPRRTLFRLLEQLCGPLTDRFVFVGNELMEQYRRAGICSTDVASVIQTGRPDRVFDRCPLGEQKRNSLRRELCGGRSPKILLVTVGRLVPAKQLEDALKIVAHLRRFVPVHLAVVGKCLLAAERQYEERLIELAQELGISDQVSFVGFREDVIDVMDAGDVVLLTSRYEGLPNVAVEAVLSGTPMVTYEVSGVREVIRNGVNGWIVPPGDLEQAVDKIMQCINGMERSDSAPVPDSDFNRFRESVMVERKMALYRECFSRTLR